MSYLHFVFRLPVLDDPPEVLSYYLSGNTTESKHFLEGIRKYNACFQMTSFGASKVIQDQGFWPTFKVQGQVYHRIGSLLPRENETAKFLQIYFLGDEDLEADIRTRTIDGTRKPIILELQNFFSTSNRYIC